MSRFNVETGNLFLSFLHVTVVRIGISLDRSSLVNPELLEQLRELRLQCIKLLSPTPQLLEDVLASKGKFDDATSLPPLPANIAGLLGGELGAEQLRSVWEGAAHATLLLNATEDAFGEIKGLKEGILFRKEQLQRVSARIANLRPPQKKHQLNAFVSIITAIYIELVEVYEFLTALCDALEANLTHSKKKKGQLAGLCVLGVVGLVAGGVAFTIAAKGALVASAVSSTMAATTTSGAASLASVASIGISAGTACAGAASTAITSIAIAWTRKQLVSLAAMKRDVRDVATRIMDAIEELEEVVGRALVKEKEPRRGWMRKIKA
ncbi:hypothetical protein M427DRAFT_57527 [Gonapodya prolifera JEL478]|uniref:Uncharacterized protein n=1 Tax=Gonapodya prolifera (strain JEL478) TaxID=1344416 RepID=A0A139ADG0_GONPJ|nr:hypothetical protein M427DRAFT_57527 [Gonapodya prolifera JEL478]|eukprot:KXS14624.1 hypothetical protein M427DRAFT_57527 [Gonapodya prolifera JEL478]